MASLGLMILLFETLLVAFSHQHQEHLLGDKFQTLYLHHFLVDVFWTVNVLLKLRLRYPVKVKTFQAYTQ